MTNDDGVESKSLLGLGKALSEQGLGVVIFAPSDNQSATGMKLNLMKPLSFIHRADLEKEWFSKNTKSNRKKEKIHKRCSIFKEL